MITPVPIPQIDDLMAAYHSELDMLLAAVEERVTLEHKLSLARVAVDRRRGRVIDAMAALVAREKKRTLGPDGGK